MFGIFCSNKIRKKKLETLYWNKIYSIIIYFLLTFIDIQGFNILFYLSHHRQQRPLLLDVGVEYEDPYVTVVLLHQKGESIERLTADCVLSQC